MAPVSILDHSLSTYTKFSKKLIFITPWYAQVRMRIRGLEMLVFWKILRTYLMDDPLRNFNSLSKFLMWLINDSR